MKINLPNLLLRSLSVRGLKVILILAFLFLFFSAPTYAHHRARVLGTSTTSSNLVVPPTTEGPGVFLPDSPLFFLDEMKQNVRLLFAFNPQDRARVYQSIAGERLAELRFMLAKNNGRGVDAALNGVSDNLEKASSEVSQAKFAGGDVSKLAKSINDNIKEKRDFLKAVKDQSDGELQTKLTASLDSLLAAKVEVEDSLKEADLQNEISDDLNFKVQDEMGDMADSTEQLENDLNELKKEASSAASNSLKQREEALQKAIETKNETLKKMEQKRLETEKKKQEGVLKVQEQAAGEALKAVEKAKEAAAKYEEAIKKAEELKTQSSD